MAFQNLRPLPMRITQRQYDRLVAHRERDHIAIQEHVRRALDNYLDLLDRKAQRELMTSPTMVADGDVPPLAEAAATLAPLPLTPQPAPNNARKLVYR